MAQKARHDITQKLRVFKYIEEIVNISKGCRHLGFPVRLITSGKEGMLN